MEASEGLLDKIRPPRLEDAGLEDCALPPDSIREAFLKAAAAAGSRASSIFGKDEGRCVDDPYPSDLVGHDLVGVSEGLDPPPGPCVAEKGSGAAEVMGDEVAAGLTEAEERGDRVMDGFGASEEERGGGEACVDGLKGLEIGDDKGKSGGKEEEKEEDGRPILGEACA